MSPTTQAAWTARDRRAMARALELAALGLATTDPNPRVGCVLMQGERVVGEGWHERAGGPHAEVVALREAGGQARGCTAYVSLEPCDHHGRTPPCSLALIEAGVGEVVYALRDPDPRVHGNGEERLRRAGIAVRGGLMAAEATQLNVGFVSRLTRGRPWVRLKLAMTLDARTALADGESRWITGEAAREDVQRFRARSSAVLTGIGTALADDPQLTVRLPGATRQPWRVVMDSALRLPPTARMIDGSGRVLVVGVQGAEAQRRRALEAAGVAVDLLPATHGRPALGLLFARLAQLQMNEVWVEGGPRLAGGLLAAGLVDELVLYVAPSLLGDEARPLVEMPAPARLAERLQLEFTDFRQLGDDLRVIARPREAGS